jgi:prefoldin subunit 5
VSSEHWPEDAPAEVERLRESLRQANAIIADTQQQLRGAVETLKRIAERDEYGKPALVSEGACQFAAHALDRLAEGAV